MIAGTFLVTYSLVFISDYIITNSDKWFLTYIKRHISTTDDSDETFLNYLDELYEKYFYPFTSILVTSVAILLGSFSFCNIGITKFHALYILNVNVCLLFCVIP